MGCPCIARVTSSEELGTMSKNNLRGITLGTRPIPRIHSLTLIICCFVLAGLHAEQNIKKSISILFLLVQKYFLSRDVVFLIMEGTLYPVQGPVSRKPRNRFGPVKPFLVHLCLKTEKCIHLKLLL